MTQTFDDLPIILVETVTSEGFVISSTGKGRSLAERLVSALFEAVERRIVLEAQPDFVASYKSLEQLAAAPDVTAFQAPGRHGYARIEDSLEWSWARPVAGGDAILIHRPTWRGVGLFPASTNGVAAGLSRDQANISALLELAERDAVLLHWYAKAAASPLDSTPVECAALLDWLEDRGFRVTLLACTAGVPIPIVLAVAEATGAHAGFAHGGVVMGSAAAATYAAASSAALLEVVQAIEAACFTVSRSGSLVDFDPALSRYLLEDSRAAFSFLKRGGGQRLHPELLDDRPLVEALADAFMKEGMQPLTIERPTSIPVRVSEATATGIQRLVLSGPLPMSQRLLRLAKRTGRGINAHPHPIA